MIRESNIQRWRNMAGEEIQVETIDDAIYIFGSELACLRIAHNYISPEIRARYSELLQSWYVCFEIHGKWKGLL